MCVCVHARVRVRACAPARVTRSDSELKSGGAVMAARSSSDRPRSSWNLAEVVVV